MARTLSPIFFLTAAAHEQYSHVRIFSPKKQGCSFLFFSCVCVCWLYKTKRQCFFFVHLCLFLQVRPKPIAASVTLKSRCRPPWNTFPVCIHHEHALNLGTISSTFSTATVVAAKIAQIGGAFAGAEVAAVQNTKLRGRGASNSSNSSTTKAESAADQAISWVGLAPRDVVCHFGGSSGEHGASERAQSAECFKGVVRGWFWRNPGFNNIWRCWQNLFFVLCGESGTDGREK